MPATENIIENTIISALTSDLTGDFSSCQETQQAQATFRNCSAHNKHRAKQPTSLNGWLAKWSMGGMTSASQAPLMEPKREMTSPKCGTDTAASAVHATITVLRISRFKNSNEIKEISCGRGQRKERNRKG